MLKRIDSQTGNNRKLNETLRCCLDADKQQSMPRYDADNVGIVFSLGCHACQTSFQLVRRTQKSGSFHAAAVETITFTSQGVRALWFTHQ